MDYDDDDDDDGEFFGGYDDGDVTLCQYCLTPFEPRGDEQTCPDCRGS